MNIVSFGTGEKLSVPQYHFKMIFIAFCLLVQKNIITCRVCKFDSEMWIIVQKSEGLEMYMLELYQNPSYKDLVAFGSLKEGKEFVSKITGYTLENEDDFVQGNKVEITNIFMKGLE